MAASSLCVLIYPYRSVLALFRSDHLLDWTITFAQLGHRNAISPLAKLLSPRSENISHISDRTPDDPFVSSPDRISVVCSWLKLLSPEQLDVSRIRQHPQSEAVETSHGEHAHSGNALCLP
ncbi:hypothetical protein B0H10DRAFT_1205788 [Mycena sp. CBHHK59/15]|nr:hypothetical protein B0H10DRAFT_1205788 [Mycena sp. CBHHK59/15]